MREVSRSYLSSRVDANVSDDGPPDPRKGLNPKVVEVYTK